MTPARSKTSRKPPPATPPEPRVNILDLLARCLSTADNQAWQELLCIIQPLAYRTCRLRSKEQRDEFSQWLTGWPRLNSTIGCAYKKLRAMLSTGGHMSQMEQLQFFQNYFTKVIQSARNDFLKERFPHTITMEEPPNNDDNNPPYMPPLPPIDQPITTDEDQPALAALANLDPSLRVPFLLTRLPDQLDDTDFQWIAQQTGQHSPAEIQKLIEDQRAAHHKKKHPLSGQFIAQLIKLSPDAVSQRVRRARMVLAAAINRARS